MAMYGQNHVISGNAIVLWDGITRPEPNDSGKLVHSLKVALLPSDPSNMELEAICQAALTADVTFKGVLPPNGLWWFMQNDPAKYEGKMAGHIEFNTKTYNGAPQIFDVNGQMLDPMAYSKMLYPGAVVQVLCHAYSYNNKSKGVTLGLDGIKIIDATAPHLNTGGVDAAAAFGGAVQPPVVQPPVVQPPVVQPPVVQPPVVQPPVVQPPVVQPPVVQPAPDFLNPAPAVNHQMTPAAGGGTYDAHIKAGWTDDQLVQKGLML